MNNEEAIAVLQNELDGIPFDLDKSDFEQALEIAIKAIRNEPIDDLSEYSDKLWKLAYERGKSEGRKTGHWNYASFGNQTLVKCSECKEEFLGNGVSDYRFCPICGCRMVKEAEND